jgi:hypothetical protein
MAFKYTDIWNTTIAAIAGGTGITSFTVASAAGAPALTAGDFTVVRIADGTGNAEDVIVTAISGTSCTCVATAIAHSNGDTLNGGILSKAALDQFADDAISGFPENALSGAGALVIGKVTNRITLTSANATFTLSDGTYKGQLCRIVIDRTSTKLVTIDPAGSTTIDGITTRVMWAGETALLAWTGSEWEKRAGKTRPMACTMFLSASQSIASATLTKVLLDSIASDNTGLMGDATNKRINFLRPNRYIVSAEVVLEMVSIASIRNLGSIKQTGSQIGSGEMSHNHTGGTAFPSPFVFTAVQWAAGDYAELFAFHVAGSNMNVFGAATLAGGATQLVALEQPDW